MFGGAAQDGTMSDEIFLLDTNTWTWTRLHCGSSRYHPHPTARTSSCLVTLDHDCVLLFGGVQRVDSDLVPRGDVWLLNVREKQWKRLWPDCHDDKNGNNKEKPNSNMVRPPPRNAATLSEIFNYEPLQLHFADGVSTTNATTITTKSCLLTGGWHYAQETWDDCYILHVSPSANR